VAYDVIKCMVISSFKKIDIHGIRAVLLDFDNTVYPYEPCHQFALRQVYRKIQTIVPVDSYKKFVDLYRQAQTDIKQHLPTQAASHSRLLYFQHLFEDAFGKTKTALSLQFETLYWESFFKKMVLREGVLDFFQNCKNQNIRICIVTDLTAQIQLKKIVHLGLEEYIDFVVSSEEAGIEKPAERLFIMALDKLGLSKEDVVVVGDSVHRDIAGAERLGIRHYLVGI